MRLNVYECHWCSMYHLPYCSSIILHLVHMVEARIQPVTRILLIYLPSPRPLNQLVPFSTLMLGPKARDSTYLLVLDFSSSIWLAHQTLA